MAATIIVNDPELALVLSSTQLSTSEGWKAVLAWQSEKTGRFAGMTSTWNRNRFAYMLAK